MLLYDWRYQTLGLNGKQATLGDDSPDLSALLPPATPDPVINVVSTVDNGDGTQTLTYSDGSTSIVGTRVAQAPVSASSYTGPPVTPDVGTGPVVNVISTVVNPDGTSTLTYSDGTTQTVGTPVAVTSTSGMTSASSGNAFTDFLAKMGIAPPSVNLPGQTFKLPGGGTISTGSVSSNRGAILTGLQNALAGIPTWVLIGIPTAGLAYLVFMPTRSHRNPRRRR